MKRLIAFLILLCGTLSFAQVTVEVRGVGQDRTTAIQDALRQAVAQVLGTKVVSEVKVQNYELLRDAIQTRTEGYVTSSEVIEETPFPDRFEVKVRATVSLSALEMDAKTLAQWLGGLRFMVVYDPRGKIAEEKELYDYAYERMNEYLARHDYRYIEREVFDRLKDEAAGISGTELSSDDWAKKIVFYSDAEFLIKINDIVIRKEEKGVGIKAIKATIDSKSFDNCTGEGLGTVVGEGDWQLSQNETEAQRKAIDGAVYNAAEKNLYLILKYLGEWCNNGAPFNLRFYGTTYKAMRKLKKKILTDQDFGGQREISAVSGYIAMNGITFKKIADELVDKIFDYAEETPGFEEMDLKLLYGRQASFALPGATVPEAVEKQKVEQLLK